MHTGAVESSGVRERLTPRTRALNTAKTTRIFLAPRWLLFHVIVFALAVTMILLGRWQLDVSNSKHFYWQNFGYAIQWWLFTAFALFVWVRVMQHRVHPPEVKTAGTGLVLAPRGQLAPRVGPAHLAVADPTEGETAIYRGYVMPQSSDGPVRSIGDGVHDAYNDYLWQLAMADGETPNLSTPPATTINEQDQ
jgi:DNA-binding transcriptional regulator of glucitol operon